MRLVVVLAVAVAVLAVGSPQADAAHGIQYGIQDDAWLEYGPGTLDQRVATLQGMGFDAVRVTLVWRNIEPSSGTFNWTRSDKLLQALVRHRLAPVVTLWGTPAWANGGAGPNVAPSDGADFAEFAREAALRFGFVRSWLVWNEPNKVTWLKPASPRTYVAQLLNPAYAAIKSVDRADRVAGGVTAPRGGPAGVSAIAFIRGMAAAGARLDAYAHNPYPLSPSETPTRDGCGCPALTMGNLNRLIALVGQAFPRARIWLTEYGYQTRPPDPFGVSLANQARYVGEAAHRAWAAPKVDMLIHYLFRDEPDLARWQSGLETVTGHPKPALQAAMLPLAEVARHGSRTVLWGQVRPGSKRWRYVVQRMQNVRWTTLGGKRWTNARGYFAVSLGAPRGSLVRVVASGDPLVSLPLLVR